MSVVRCIEIALQNMECRMPVWRKMLMSFMHQHAKTASSEGAVQMIVTKREVMSVEDATAKLDALARRWGIDSPRYEESEADSLSEFDALEWICLCSQRVALQQREKENSPRDCSTPSILRSLYGHNSRATSVKPEDVDEGQLRFAA
jgi:hypothetical protein